MIVGDPIGGVASCDARVASPMGARRGDEAITYGAAPRELKHRGTLPVGMVSGTESVPNVGPSIAVLLKSTGPPKNPPTEVIQETLRKVRGAEGGGDPRLSKSGGDDFGPSRLGGNPRAEFGLGVKEMIDKGPRLPSKVGP